MKEEIERERKRNEKRIRKKEKIPRKSLASKMGGKKSIPSSGTSLEAQVSSPL